MVGGGQLARMTHEAGIPLGIRFKLLSDTPQDSAAQVVGDVVIGDYRDLDTLREFARGCDVITFDHEHVPTEHLRALEADGIPVRPGPDALVHAQDKGVMRARLDALGIPVPTAPDRERSGRRGRVRGRRATGFPVVLKTVRGGYDGKGVWVVDSVDGGRRALPRRRPGPRRGEGRLRTGAGGERRTLPARPGRRLPGRRVPAGRRRLRHGHRARPRPGRGPRPAGRGAGPAHRQGTGRRRPPRRRAVPDPRRPHPRQRAGDAPAQLRPLDAGRRDHLPVRQPRPRGPRPPARRPAPARDVDGHGATSSAATTRTCTPRTCTAWPATPS